MKGAKKLQVWFEENKKRIIVITGGIVGVFIIIMMTWKTTKQNSLITETTMMSETVITTDSEQDTLKSDSQEKWFVDIKGAIKFPGMYPVETDMRIFDVIELAGGLSEEADRNQVNLAEHVRDQMVIYIPKVGENLAEVMLPTETSTSHHDSDHAQAENETLVNLNTATAQELQTLSGIGEKKAEAIITYRETNGSFQTIDDLKKVKGIGEKTFDSLKESITIN
ncbi:helix-hairpin-helix domain-containing protein [Vagococcus lutrae]|uniref:Helix-hairpin-helix domain-containing protein n=1 Tax=Vagococcus lutrae TaxID=81947 RepID=A0AAE9XH55_9ENTE|nr:helix-hairpin-helix domain-containing protein [Vagococcus lutrae]WCG23307.1 helix-hairpin-helix domain-containing protein [Vagococcus lutrae]